MSYTIEQTIEQFLTQDRKGWAKRTRETYRTALNRFVQYLADVERVPPSSPTLVLASDPDILIRYADFLAKNARPMGKAESGLSELTYRVYLSALGLWHAYLFEIETLAGVSADDLLRVQMRLSGRRDTSLDDTQLREEEPRRAPPAEVAGRLLQVARTDVPDPEVTGRDRERAELRRLRNVALLETLRSTGARISEVLGLSLRDLMDDKTAHVPKTVAKGGKARDVFFDKKSWSALQLYLSASGVRRGDEPLFLRHDRGAGDKRKRLSPTGAQGELRRLRGMMVNEMRTELIRLLLPECLDEDVERLLAAFDRSRDALPEELQNALREQGALAEAVSTMRMRLRQAERITAHSFRHALGSVLLEATGDLAAVQDILGHADPSTTRRYAQLSNARLKAVHRGVLK